jgi:glycosyltransferase involved in cell wall biosynthesis
MAYYIEVNRRRPRLTVATLHNNYSRVGVDFSPASLFARAFAMTSRVATVSHDSRRWLLSVRPELAETTCTIHNGLPVSDAPVVPLPWSPPTLMYVGRVEAQKRLDVLLRAFAQLVETHPDVRLKIVGAGTESGSVAELARSLGLQHRVELLGRVELDEVPRLLDEATVAVLSSDFEGLPMALLEAARQGRPTVATAVGGVPELVLDGHTGLLVDRDSPQAFARAVATLLDDRPLAERFGRAARARFTAEFSLDACADAYDRLYHEVAEAHPRVPAEAMAGMG